MKNPQLETIANKSSNGCLQGGCMKPERVRQIVLSSGQYRLEWLRIQVLFGPIIRVAQDRLRGVRGLTQDSRGRLLETGNR